MTRQPAITTGTVMNAVSTISGSEMPSTPSAYQASKRGIHGSFSTSCSAAVPVSNEFHSSSDSASVATEASIASQRPATMWPWPSSTTAKPAAMGNQMRIDRRPCIASGCASVAGVRQEPADQQRQADHHPERVTIEVTALHATQQAPDPAHRCRAAVDHRAVDQRLIAPLPQAHPDEPRERGEDLLIEPVEVVFVREYAVQPAEGADADRGARPLRPPQEAGPGRSRPGEREPERRRRQAVQCELHRTAEVGSERADDVVPGEHQDRMPEVAAEQHRAHGKRADEDGG